MEPIQIRVVNLPWKATEDEVRAFIGVFSKVTEVKLILDSK